MHCLFFSFTPSSPTPRIPSLAQIPTAAATLSFIAQHFPSSYTPCWNNLYQILFIVCVINFGVFNQAHRVHQLLTCVFHMKGIWIHSWCAQTTEYSTGLVRRRAAKWLIHLVAPFSSSSFFSLGLPIPIKPVGFLTLPQALLFGGATTFRFPESSERGGEGRSWHPS